MVFIPFETVRNMLLSLLSPFISSSLQPSYLVLFNVLLQDICVGLWNCFLRFIYDSNIMMYVDIELTFIAGEF